MKLLPVFFLAAVLPLRGQTPTDEELFGNGKRALEARDYFEAAVCLFAYVQRNPAAMQVNPAHAAQVRDAYSFARNSVAQTISRVSQLEQQVRNQNAGGDVGAKSAGLTAAPPPLDDPKASAPGSYPLLCRGGGGLNFSLQPGADGIQGPTLVVGFRRAAVASADGSSLAPGECTWLDRPVSPAEPDHFCQRTNESSFRLAWSTDGMTRNLSSTSAPFLENLIYADRFATVGVFNNGEGCFVVTDPGLGRIKKILKVRAR